MTDAVERIYEQMLVLRCQAGDQHAFETLVRRYHPRLRYYAQRLLDDASLTEDVLQEVWLIAYRRVGRLRSPAAWTVWLYRITRSQALLALRRRRRELDWDNLPADYDVATPEPEFSAQDAARMHAALRHLPPAQREVLVLCYVEGMSYEEIADVLSCPLGTVRSRIHYAKRALRAAMGD